MIARLLFEEPVFLPVILSPIVVFLLVRWAHRRDAASTRAAWLGLAALVALPMVSTVVVTSREEVIACCRELACAVDDGDLHAIGERLADDFRVASLDRTGFLDRLEGTLTRFRVDEPRLTRFEVGFPSSRTASATFSATARLRSPEAILDRLPTRWQVAFQRVNDQWRVSRLESIPVPPLNLKTTDDWLR